jgi:hypothetical protein
MIASLGLLTPEGLAHFYAIFDDYENMGDKHRDLHQFFSPHVTPYNGEEGEAKLRWEHERKQKYLRWLKDVSALITPNRRTLLLI